MSGGLAAFFGLPLGGALFVLEVPHRMGIQYFEALGPSIVCTIISVIVAKSITQEDLGALSRPTPFFCAAVLTTFCLQVVNMCSQTCLSKPG
jgi:H+/Cl- antiporter ClcA